MMTDVNVIAEETPKLVDDLLPEDKEPSLFELYQQDSKLVTRWLKSSTKDDDAAKSLIQACERLSEAKKCLEGRIPPHLLDRPEPINQLMHDLMKTDSDAAIKVVLTKFAKNYPGLINASFPELLDSGCYAEDDEDTTILITLVDMYGWKPQIIEHWIDCGADIDQYNNKGATALIRALDDAQGEAATCLLRNGADPNRGISEDMYSSMPLAIRNRLHPALVNMINNGADLEMHPNIALYAAIFGSPKCIDILADAGVDPGVLENPDSATYYVFHNGSEKMKKAFEKAWEGIFEPAPSPSSPSGAYLPPPSPPSGSAKRPRSPVY